MKAEDFIQLIEQNRFDKISNNGLKLIAKRFRELEKQALSISDVSQRSELLKVLEYTRQIKGNPKEIQLLVDKMYLENL